MSSKLLNELDRKEKRSKRSIESNPMLKDNEVLLLEAHSEDQEEKVENWLNTEL